MNEPIKEGVSVYRSHKELLDSVLAQLEAQAVSPFELYAYWRALGMKRDRDENVAGDSGMTPEEQAKYGVWEEWDAQLDANMDEASDYVRMNYDEIGEAMVVLYGGRS